MAAASNEANSNYTVRKEIKAMQMKLQAQSLVFFHVTHCFMLFLAQF